MPKAGGHFSKSIVPIPSILGMLRHAVGYDLKGATGTARVAVYVASGFPFATNMRDGKMPCGPSNDEMSRDLQVMRLRQ